MGALAVELFSEVHERSETPARSRAGLTRPELAMALEHLQGGRWLLAALLYYCELRATECVRLRVRDVDTLRRRLVVRARHSGRAVDYPASLQEPLLRHLERVRELHRQDLAEGFGAVWYPGARGQEWQEAGRAWCWQFLFPSRHRAIDLRGNTECRCHADPRGLLRTLRLVANQSAGFAAKAAPTA